MRPANSPGYRGLSRTTPIPACVISPEELRRLYSELNAKSEEANEKHISAHLNSKPAEMTDEQWTNLIAEARSRGVLTTIVNSQDGDTLITYSDQALSEQNLPDRVSEVIFDSANLLKLVNITPLNRFRLVLDFTMPGIFGTYNLWENPTPNDSQLEITGSDQTWTNGVHEHVMAFFRRRKKPRGLMHTALAFNIVNWLFAIPVAFWIVYRLDVTYAEQVAQWPVALRGCLYVYAVLVIMAIFRGMMHALRWAFPVVELKGSRANGTRVLVVGVLVALVLGLASDIVSGLLTLL